MNERFKCSFKKSQITSPMPVELITFNEWNSEQHRLSKDNKNATESEFPIEEAPDEQRKMLSAKMVPISNKR
ncbi:hypothetical protein ACTXT7_012445, partial [Hymenolepis weldensis]